MFKILIVHGPNLNLLGEREPAIYGSTTLPQVNAMIRKEARGLKVTPRFFQSNSEGALIDFLHKHRKWADGVVMNPGAYTHTSIAIRDAISAISLPVMEVHLSDLREREEFRKISMVREVCVGAVMGLGPKSYTEGLKLLLAHLKESR